MKILAIVMFSTSRFLLLDAMMSFRCILRTPAAGQILRLLLFFVLCIAAAWNGNCDEVTMNLPKEVDGWTLSEKPRSIAGRGLFEYMDGAGELYLAYRFKHLDVYEYASPGEERIVVELYWMESSDDAFGLLSGDWDGAAADLGKPKATVPANPPWSVARTVYGRGLLRVWSDDLYVRVMAVRETPKSKAAVMSLGKLIVAGRKNPDPPALLAALPGGGEGGLKIRPDRVCFFRSYLVLNNIYFLSTENILDLGHAVEAATTTYASPATAKHASPRLLLVRYPDAATAQAAIAHFEKIYLPEKHATATKSDAAAKSESSPAAFQQFFKIEDGWLGYGVEKNAVGIAFQCLSREAAERFVADAFHNLNKPSRQEQ